MVSAADHYGDFRPRGAAQSVSTEALETLANLLLCVDPAREQSLARPSARGLGFLIHALLALEPTPGRSH